eukprot:Sdes_comp9353_c0_seq1m827
MSDLFAQICFSDFFHFSKHHGTDFFRGKQFFTSLNIDGNMRLAIFVHKLEGKEFHIFLYSIVIEATSNQSLDIENSLSGIGSQLILGSISNQTLVIGKGNIGGSNTVSLVVGNNFNSSVFIDTHT